MLFCCFKLQIAQDTAAILTVRQDKLFSNQYLRVTLKSVYAITGFIVKAVDHKNEDNKGNIYIRCYQYKKLLSALGTWYLPYLAPTTTISSSSYRNCSGHHNALTHSGLLQDIYVVFFQWMPDVNYDGRVVFRGLVRRGDSGEWEDVKHAQVEVEAAEKVENEVQKSEKTTYYWQSILP